MIAIVRFDGMIPLPGSDEHVSGFYASDGWALTEEGSKLIVEGHGKRYAFTGYAYGTEEDPPTASEEPKTGKRRRA